MNENIYEEDMVFKSSHQENGDRESGFQGDDIAKRAFTTLA
jgi:hypothetical protein